jgi:hypothetical protein
MQPTRRLRGRNWSKADILVYRLGEMDVAVKDYSARPFLVRNTLGRYLTRREAAAYRAAAGLPGVPEFLGRVSPFALATRWVEARTLTELRGQPLDDGVFDRIGEVVGALHARGIALADLHRPDVLLARDGSVFVLDLATAWILGDRPGRLRRVLFERMLERDLVALARMRARCHGRDPDAEMAALGRSAVTWHRRALSAVFRIVTVALAAGPPLPPPKSDWCVTVP